LVAAIVTAVVALIVYRFLPNGGSRKGTAGNVSASSETLKN